MTRIPTGALIKSAELELTKLEFGLFDSDTSEAEAAASRARLDFCVAHLADRTRDRRAVEALASIRARIASL